MAVLEDLDQPGAPGFAGRARRAATAGLVVWTLVTLAAVLWPRISPLNPAAGISAAPFYGHWAWSRRGWMVLAVALGLVAVLWFPTLFTSIGTRWVAPIAGVAGVTWAVTLAATGGGLHHIASPLESTHGVLPFSAHIDGSTFLWTFLAHAQRYPTHVKGHPPGLVFVFWALDRVGLQGPGWAAALVLAVWGLGVAAVVWTVGRLAGSATARQAAPFTALVPGVVWAATSVDALIAGVTAVGIALVVDAIVGGPDRPVRGRRADLAALAGGLVVGLSLFLSYGVAPLLLVPVAVALRSRRFRPLVIAAIGVAVVVGLFRAGGFWWFDGLSSTRGFYLEGLARVRPYWYFVLAGNLGALALAVGPAAGVGLGRMIGEARRRPELVVIGAVLVAVLAADVSGMSKAEVERIWLPFTLWLAAAGGAAVAAKASVRQAQGWLAVQVGLALALQAWLVTPW